MKFQYLGTAAYEGIPSLFCSCGVCRRSRALGGRNIRSRSQAIINDELLLDFPPDTVWHSIQYGLDWEKIGDCLITHSHSDHLYPEDVEMAEADYTGEHRVLHFYAAKDGYEKLRRMTERPTMHGEADVKLIEPGRRFYAGSRGQYQVMPLWANHEQETSPVIYSILWEDAPQKENTSWKGDAPLKENASAESPLSEKDRMDTAPRSGKVLYAHDTGVFPENTWEMLKEEGRYDLISLDCTGGPGMTGEWRNGHMSLKTNLEVVEQMRKEGMADDDTIIVCNHFSHNCGQVYEELVAEAAKYGILVSYDGMTLAF